MFKEANSCLLVTLVEAVFFSLSHIFTSRFFVVKKSNNLLESRLMWLALLLMLSPVEQTLQYWRDQKQVEAFHCYLTGIEDHPAQQDEPSLYKLLYEKLLTVYLDPQGGNPAEVAKKILVEAPVVPDDAAGVAFIVAAAHANLNEFPAFFTTFYPAYQRNGEHFLAYKAKAALHLKLYERATDPAERERQREVMVTLIRKASQLEPRDTSLIKLEIVFVDEKERQEVVRSGLNKIIMGNRMVPRSEVAFYAGQAIHYELWEEANAFLDLADVWYPESRVVTANKALLKTKRSKG